MLFQRLLLTHLRSHSLRQLDLAPGLNAITGLNGVGKTTVLEAVHLLCMARGFGADKELVTTGQSYLMVEGHLAEADCAKVMCSYVEGRGKKVLVDGQPLPRLADHIGRLPVVAVLPTDTDLVRESGSTRRRWLDALLAQADQAYLLALLRYERALTQRNALLQTFADQGRFAASELALYDEPLAQAGVLIWDKRRSFFADFAAVLAQRYRQIADSDEAPALHYHTQVQHASPQAWVHQLQAHLAADRSAARSTFGTHRDDVLFSLAGRPVKQYASQGQQKSYLIALKLAQHSWLAQQSSKAPFLLLDDFFDKLDAQRAERLVRMLLHELPGQKLLTHTSAAAVQALMPDAATVNIVQLS